MTKNHKIVDILLDDNLHRAVNYYGIEATEDKIKHVYRSMPKIRDIMLVRFKEIYLKKD